LAQRGLNSDLAAKSVLAQLKSVETKPTRSDKNAPDKAGIPTDAFVVAGRLITELASKSGLKKQVVHRVLHELLTIAARETQRRGGFVFPWLGKMTQEEGKTRSGFKRPDLEKIGIEASKVRKFRLVEFSEEALVQK